MNATFWVIFSVMSSVAAVVIVVYVLRHRNKHAYFRPRVGEVVLASLVALTIAGISSYCLAVLFGMVTDFDPEAGGKRASSINRGVPPPTSSEDSPYDQP